MKSNSEKSIRKYTFQNVFQVAGKNFPATVIVTHSKYRVLDIDLKFDLLTLAQLLSLAKITDLNLTLFVEETRKMADAIVFPPEQKLQPAKPKFFYDVNLITHQEYRAWQLISGVDAKYLSSGYGLAIRDCLDNPNAQKVRQLLKEIKHNGKENPDLMQQIIGGQAMAAILSLPNY